MSNPELLSATKTCTACGEGKPMDEFWRYRKTPDGHQSWCKECQKAYRRANPEARRKWDQRGRRRNPNTHRCHNARWVRRNREKKRAQGLVRTELRAGRLQRPSACSECGVATSVDAHHDDYSKPYEITWLCRACHVARHREVV